jgi:hypothetical protein
MKKILILLLLSLGLMGFANAEERVNLSCAFYEYFKWDNHETSKVKPEDESLVIFPEIKMYIYQGVKGNYSELGNTIAWTLTKTIPDIQATTKEFSLDRTTGVFKYNYYIYNPGDEILDSKVSTITGKCNKSENIF